MLIDTHCHLTYPGLIEQADAVVARAADAGVTRMITIGTDAGDHPKVLQQLQRFDGVFGALGVHPHHAHEISADFIIGLREYFRQESKFLAVGECGLDYHHASAPREVQASVFEAQLALAVELNLPVILHVRDAHDDASAIVRNQRPKNCVVHCFTGSVTEVRTWLDLGAYIGFTGIVTYKNAAHVADACREVPESHLLVETDAPYLSPVPKRSIKINEPAFVVHTAEHVAAMRGVTPAQIADTTTANAGRLFGRRLTD
ncbi:MAG: TatD family hydrolase [Phycisphaerae bacterium]